MKNLEYSQEAKILNNMRIYGGSFIKKLGSLYMSGDATNKRKLLEAFPEYFTKYLEM